MQKLEPVPIACTLDMKAMGPRLAEIGQLTREHLRSHRVDGRTLHLTYDAGAARQVARIVELERACCAFLDFDLKASTNEVGLTITAPEQEGTDAQWLFAQFMPAVRQPEAQAPKANECACCRGCLVIAQRAQEQQQRFLDVRAITITQAAQQLLGMRVEGLVQLNDRPLAFGGERDEPAPGVGWIRFLGHQATLDHRVDRA